MLIKTTWNHQSNLSYCRSNLLLMVHIFSNWWKWYPKLNSLRNIFNLFWLSSNTYNNTESKKKTQMNRHNKLYKKTYEKYSPSNFFKLCEINSLSFMCILINLLIMSRNVAHFKYAYVHININAERLSTKW